MSVDIIQPFAVSRSGQLWESCDKSGRFSTLAICPCAPDNRLGQVKYLILDARYEKVRHGGSIADCAVFTAIGVDPEGRRGILEVSVSLPSATI